MAGKGRAALSSSSANDDSLSSSSSSSADEAPKLSDADRIKQMWAKEEALSIEVTLHGIERLSLTPFRSVAAATLAVPTL